MLAFNTYLVLTDAEWAINFFEFRETNINTTSFKLWLGLIIIVNLFVTYMLEKVVIW